MGLRRRLTKGSRLTGEWTRLGRILQPAGAPLQDSHVMLPTPLVLEDRVRVYYAACDQDLRGRIFAADFGLEPPFPLLSRWTEPVLDLGKPGAFDCDGVNPSQVIAVEDRLALLYIGWRRSAGEDPYSLIAGLAFSSDGGRTFDKAGELLPPIAGEALFRTAPFLSRVADGWRLLYIGGGEFFSGAAGKRLPVYSLMELRGADPCRWSGPGRTLRAPNRAAGEIGFGRPWVRADETLMISVRTEGGYELLEDSTPVFQAPFEPWESSMRCFGATCLTGGHELLFYNGDGFGRTGMGLAYRPVSDSR